MTTNDHVTVTVVPAGVGMARYVIVVGSPTIENISCSGVVDWKHLWVEVEQKLDDLLVDKMNLEGK